MVASRPIVPNDVLVNSRQIAPSDALPAGGGDGDVLTKVEGAPAWAAPTGGAGLPAGGADGDVLSKVGGDPVWGQMFTRSSSVILNASDIAGPLDFYPYYTEIVMGADDLTLYMPPQPGDFRWDGVRKCIKSSGGAGTIYLDNNRVSGPFLEYFNSIAIPPGSVVTLEYHNIGDDRWRIVSDIGYLVTDPFYFYPPTFTFLTYDGYSVTVTKGVITSFVPA